MQRVAVWYKGVVWERYQISDIGYLTGAAQDRNKGPSIKDVQTDGGGDHPKVGYHERGGGRLYTGHPQTKKKIVFWSPYRSQTPPVHGYPDCNIFCVFDVFTHDTVSTTLDGGGVFQTDDVGQGGCPKSQLLLGRLWCMTPKWKEMVKCALDT